MDTKEEYSHEELKVLHSEYTLWIKRGMREDQSYELAVERVMKNRRIAERMKKPRNDE